MFKPGSERAYASKSRAHVVCVQRVPGWIIYSEQSGGRTEEEQSHRGRAAQGGVAESGSGRYAGSKPLGHTTPIWTSAASLDLRLLLRRCRFEQLYWVACGL